MGRAGHQVGAPSKGVIFPKYRGDLLEVAVVTRRMHEGAIEATTMPRNPLDVLAQQIVAMAVMDRWQVDELLAVVNRAAPYETLSRDVLEGVLGMLAGAYPSDEFAELKPRVVWDRVTDTIEGPARRAGRGDHQRRHDPGPRAVRRVHGRRGRHAGRRVGELDEEMVYESRVGEVITLGASSWRIEEIGHDQVTVSPAPGVPGKLPFWHGDAVGRPIELGRALGAFVGELEGDLARGDTGRRAAAARLREAHDLDERAADNLLMYLEDEREATASLPTDRRIVVERFRDELGDWRLCLLTPFGGRVHAPWPLASRRDCRNASAWRSRRSGPTTGSPSGCPKVTRRSTASRTCSTRRRSRTWSSGRWHRRRSSRAASARTRHGPCCCHGAGRDAHAARQQRQRAAGLLAVASRYGSFPILVETYRECLSDVFDLPALREVLESVARRDIGVHSVETLRARRSRARCSSTTSPPTCTTAMRHWPNAVRAP